MQVNEFNLRQTYVPAALDPDPAVAELEKILAANHQRAVQTTTEPKPQQTPRQEADKHFSFGLSVLVTGAFLALVLILWIEGVWA